MRTQAGIPNRPGLGVTRSKQPDWQIVAEAVDGKEAVAQVLKTAPNVAIVDYSLPSSTEWA
jgi:DNA-binding NarL/FixJ family response regulator